MDIDNQIPVIRIGDIQNGKVDYENCLKVNKDDNLEAYTVKLADIVIAMSGATTGKIATIDNEKKAYINQRVGIIRSKNNKFIKYCLENESFIKYINLLSAGSAQPNISMGNILDFKIPYISQREQETIAGYLDKKCGEIDRVIEVQKEVIEKLKEYKQSVITEAVTKGLDKSVPLKDSGIEWIDKIPQHWEIKKLKFITNCNTKVLDEKTPSETIINYIEIGSVTNENGINDFQTMLFENSPSRARRIVTTGDTILSTVRTYLKAIAYIDKSYDNFICSTGFAVFTPMQDILPKFLFHALHSEWFVSIVEANSVGISYPAINTSNILNYKISVPAIEEQEQILKYLDKKCFEIDSSISDKEQLIEKLTEYKKSLIYECVTGKRKVAGCHCEECK